MQKGISLIEVMVSICLFGLISTLFFGNYSVMQRQLAIHTWKLNAALRLNNALAITQVSDNQSLLRQWTKSIKQTLPGGIGQIACNAKQCHIVIHWQTSPYQLKTTVPKVNS